MQIISSGDDIVHGLIALEPGRIATITNKALIKLYDISSGECIK